MARPKLGDSDTERLHLKITADEIAAIDEWRYENRIPSRSEAVRRLVQIGLLADTELQEVVDMASNGIDVLSDHNSELSNVFRMVINRETHGMTFDRDQLWDIFTMAREQADVAENGLRALHTFLVTMFNAVAAIVEARSMRGATQKAKRVINKANRAVDQATKKKAAREKEAAENRYLTMIFTAETSEERQRYEALPESKKDAYLKAKIAALEAEEKADPEAFAKRHGIDTRKFWEKPEWEDLLDKLRAERGDK